MATHIKKAIRWSTRPPLTKAARVRDEEGKKDRETFEKRAGYTAWKRGRRRD
jgi:hypothetical protein